MSESTVTESVQAAPADQPPRGKRIAIDGGFLFRDPARPELWCSVLYVAESDEFIIL